MNREGSKGIRVVWPLLAVMAGCGEAEEPSRVSERAVANAPERAVSGVTERVISHADFGDEWPFVVESGTLRCHAPSAVTFTSGDVTYAVNGMASTLEAGVPIEPIWALQPPRDPGIEVVERIPLSDRKEIFRQLGVCEDRAMEQAEAEIPVTDLASMERMADRMDELETDCKGDVRNTFGINEDEALKIGVEGVFGGGFSAATPLRISIGPVIQAGLTLCGAVTP